MSSAISLTSHLLPAATSGASQKNTPVSVSDPLANEQTFLKLLVSQLKNQDPLKPTDSNQFVSQLTSYSQLEQLIGIRQNTTTVPVEPPVTTPATTPATTPPSPAV